MAGRDGAIRNQNPRTKAAGPGPGMKEDTQRPYQAVALMGVWATPGAGA